MDATVTGATAATVTAHWTDANGADHPVEMKPLPGTAGAWWAQFTGLPDMMLPWFVHVVTVDGVQADSEPGTLTPRAACIP